MKKVIFANLVVVLYILRKNCMKHTVLPLEKLLFLVIKKFELVFPVFFLSKRQNKTIKPSNNGKIADGGQQNIF